MARVVAEMEMNDEEVWGDALDDDDDLVLPPGDLGAGASSAQPAPEPSEQADVVEELMEVAEGANEHDPVDGSLDLTAHRSADPRAARCLHPYLWAGGRRFSARTLKCGPLSKILVLQVTMAALQHAHSQGKLLHVIMPEQGKETQLLRVALYFHYHRCRLSKTVLMSSYQTSIEVTREGRHDASQFALVEVPEQFKASCSRQGRLQPVQIRTYAMIKWAGVSKLQRLAYVKLLPYTMLEVVAGSGQMVYEFNRRCALSWAHDECLCFCIDVESIKQPVALVEGEACRGRLVLDRLIPFRGKKLQFGEHAQQLHQDDAESG